MEAKKEKELLAVVEGAKNAVISTVDGNGWPQVRAMNAPRKVNGLAEIWFSTNTSSQKVAQIRANPKTCVYFYDKKMFYHGVMLIGTAEISESEADKKEIWRFGDTMYYKGGVADPDYCVLKFKAEKARYYHAFKNADFEI
ncbi:MAG: pyridoxamine 5'-phosphate oxidase family protein [Clostridiales bacterium]|jgi:general stress protein 26|nr:pyridoxamine 5'-phosphate oxidase family protein [Clostridiales bacterium]